MKSKTLNYNSLTSWISPVQTDLGLRRSYARVLIFLGISLTVGVGPCWGQTDSEESQRQQALRINAANQKARNNKLDEALDEYRAIDATSTNQDQLNYNMAVAHYRNGDVDSALSLFGAATTSGLPGIAAKSRYNAGNCHYSKALEAAPSEANQQPDIASAIEHLGVAISQYRSSLRIEPENSDARANIELAAQLLRKLKEEQQKQQDQENQQSEEQQSQDSDSQDSDSQDADSQQNDQDSNSENQSDNEEQESDQPNSEQQDQEQNDPNEDDSKSSEQDKRKQNEQKPEQKQNESEQQPPESAEQNNSDQNSSDQKNEDSNKSQSKQPSQQQNDNNGEPREDSSPSETQPSDLDQKEKATPSGELTAADQNENNPSNGATAGAAATKQQTPMTREEAMKMLQAVRDRDMLRRLQQERRARSRRVPVDRDW